MSSIEIKRRRLADLLSGKCSIKDLLPDYTEPDYEKMTTEQLKTLVAIFDRIPEGKFKQNDLRLTAEDKAFLNSLPHRKHSTHLK